MLTVTIELSDDMKAFIQAQVEENGYATAEDYLLALVRDAQLSQAKLKLEATLRKALEDGPAEVMTRDDWESIEREALKGLDREQIRP